MAPRVYLDTASLNLLIEQKTEAETECVRQLLSAAQRGEVGVLHSDIVDSWLWGARAQSRKLALGPELAAAGAENVSSSLPLTKFSASALQKLSGEQKGELYKALNQAFARYFYQRSELGLIIATMTAIQNRAEILVSPEAAKWQRFVFANVERIAKRESGVALKLAIPSRALSLLKSHNGGPAA